MNSEEASVAMSPALQGRRTSGTQPTAGSEKRNPSDCVSGQQRPRQNSADTSTLATALPAKQVQEHSAEPAKSSVPAWITLVNAINMCSLYVDHAAVAADNNSFNGDKTGIYLPPLVADFLPTATPGMTVSLRKGFGTGEFFCIKCGSRDERSKADLADAHKGQYRERALCYNTVPEIYLIQDLDTVVEGDSDGWRRFGTLSGGSELGWRGHVPLLVIE
ncbi:hypothetical protein EJ08DRAFT_497301 [Tothia fuscella]|uniref:Uncharacterized protein n=1 Tax=Tothia fuscella TaxID=1048955 RepID=A0A9P4NXJ3_9PEZI|nr:hypothetical protein EJ08DRAFT_497301 [Tothia fuscella]